LALLLRFQIFSSQRWRSCIWIVLMIGLGFWFFIIILTLTILVHYLELVIEVNNYFAWLISLYCVIVVVYYLFILLDSIFRRLRSILNIPVILILDFLSRCRLFLNLGDLLFLNRFRLNTEAIQEKLYNHLLDHEKSYR
jgi:hypothetical protein